MKKILLLASLAVMLVACSKESALPDPVNTAGQGTTMLSFKVGLPAGEPITYAEIQTNAEKQVQRFDIYQFAPGDDGLLEATYNNVPLTSTATGYTANVGIQGTGVKQFFFVANNMGSNVGGVTAIENMANGTIKAVDFKEKMTMELSSSNLKSPLLMTAYLPSVDVQAAPASTPRQTVELTRVMSRLDIRNFEPKLTITRVRLEKTNDRSFAFHQAGAKQNPTDGKLIALPEVTLPTTAVSGDVPIEMEQVPLTGGVLAHTFYKHVFYPYVRDEVTAEADAPQLVIEGILFKGDKERETKVVYKKALKVKDKPNFLGFARNTRYTFIIEKAISGEMTANFKVDKWNEESVNAPLEVSAPTPTILYDWSGYTEERVTLALPVVTVRKDFTSDILIKVSSNTEWEVFPEGNTTVPTDGKMTEWLRAKPVNTYWGTIIPKNTLNTELQLNLTANDTGSERSVRIILCSKADKNKQYILTVKQRA